MNTHKTDGPMSKVDRAALRALAEAATPGGWAHEADIREDRCGKSEVVGWNINSGTQEIIGCEGILGDGKPDAAYIAAAHPAAVLELLDEVARLREALHLAEQFIVNGCDLGFIRMPDRGDPALHTLPAIRAALGRPGA